MFNITFQQIEAFMAVAEHLNLTDTAGKMYITQSALSKIIARLEKGIEVKLFTRESRGVSLTKEGSYLYEAFKQPYKTVIKAISEAQAMQRRPKRSLRIGCPGAYDYNSDYDIIKKATDDYIEKHPDVEVSETIYESEPQKDALLFSEVDIIISKDFVVNSLKDVTSIRISPLGTYIAISEKHPLAVYDELPYSELANETFYAIHFGSQTEIENIIRRSCSAMGFEPKAVKVVPNMPSLIRAIGTGRGVSICGRIDKTASDVPIKYYPLPKYPGFKEHYIMAAWRTGDLSREAVEFIDMIKEIKFS